MATKKSKKKKPVKKSAKKSARKPAKKGTAKKKGGKKKSAAKKKGAKGKAKSKPKPKAKARPKPGNPKPAGPPPIDGTLLGRVDDFFAQVGVIALTLKSPLKVGDSIHIKGHTTDSIETVVSMQIDHQSVESAQKGDSIGIKISVPARKRDWVFRL